MNHIRNALQSVRIIGKDIDTTTDFQRSFLISCFAVVLPSLAPLLPHTCCMPITILWNGCFTVNVIRCCTIFSPFSSLMALNSICICRSTRKDHHSSSKKKMHHQTCRSTLMTFLCKQEAVRVWFSRSVVSFRSTMNTTTFHTSAVNALFSLVFVLFVNSV